jgi:dihydroneopterin aldolase
LTNGRGFSKASAKQQLALEIKLKKFRDSGAFPIHFSSDSYTVVEVLGLITERRVGIHPWEMHPEKPNRLIIDIELYSNRYGGVDSGPILDYDHVRDELKTWPSKPHTRFLETLFEELFPICFQDPRVEASRIRIHKPDIFNEADGAGLTMFRRRD